MGVAVEVHPRDLEGFLCVHGENRTNDEMEKGLVKSIAAVGHMSLVWLDRAENLVQGSFRGQQRSEAKIEDRDGVIKPFRSSLGLRAATGGRLSAHAYLVQSKHLHAQPGAPLNLH